MPVNTTVSHVSPLISYIPRSAWFEGTASDPNLENYAYKSYHATNNTESGNASVAFSWWGTGVWVHGGYRRRLGDYAVTLDGNTTFHQGYVDGAYEDFQAVLFNATDLPAGPHHLRITNASNDPKRPVFDLDYIVFESNLNETKTVFHTSADCTWFPQGDGVWEEDMRSHSTDNSLGAMELAFTGTRISRTSSVHSLFSQICSGSGFILYGQLDMTSAPLSVTIDGRSSHAVSPNTAISPLVNASQVLFAVTDLNEGMHTIRVENNPSHGNATARHMDIMFGKVLSSPSFSQPQLPVPPSSSQRSAVIFAASFGSLGLFLLCILIWRVCVCMRQKASKERDGQLPRPFFARTDASPSPSTSYPYQRTHRSQLSYAHATSRHSRRGHLRGNTELMGEINALQRSFSRMRRPAPATVSFPQAQPRWNDNRHWTSKAAALEADDEDDSNNDDLQFAAPESYSPRLQRHPTDATSSSYTMYDSMSVNVPPSPTSPGIWSPQSQSQSQSGAMTSPLRVGRIGPGLARRSSIEKPPRRQLVPVGSPVASTPSLVTSRALPPPPPPVAGFVFDPDMLPPPYRFLDTR
ncbi:hypothetical protein L226DRAFT_574212 [Lentinus tigrinus ALCF2SS1-7]|uniref:uncharacterized protein n=1 Tax=Lentinus tigrinus ALCF2SS1-7 TaxID=1328758 RepID=UPI001166115A|nr:hypothetical protein L226DRAFT_574212 [Lentinus tigrinus ALCF2SS1-7]